MPLFGRKLPEQDKPEALKLVHHVQTMFAFQQLTMEMYNNAMVAASAGSVSLGPELAHQQVIGGMTLTDVSKHILPATAHKLGVIEEMEKQHLEFSRPTLAVLTKAYDSCSLFITAMKERATKQQEGWLSWIVDPTVSTIDTGREDRAEAKAVDACIASMNDVFKRLHLDFGDLVAINREAANRVRDEIGLRPLELDEYASMYMAGLQGRPVRLFTA